MARTAHKNVTVHPDRHGKLRWIFRKVGYSSHYFHAPYGSEAFEQELALVLAGKKIIRKKVKPRTSRTRRMGEAKAIKGPVVYFVGVGRSVKIGYSTALASRLKALQMGQPKPVELLAAIPGTKELESSLHKQFESAWIGGEWFERTPELTSYIADLVYNRICITTSGENK